MATQKKKSVSAGLTFQRRENIPERALLVINLVADGILIKPKVHCILSFLINIR